MIIIIFQVGTAYDSEFTACNVRGDLSTMVSAGAAVGGHMAADVAAREAAGRTKEEDGN